MGHHCCVPRCNSNSRYTGTVGLTFHAFPIDPKERKLWILSVRRADYSKLTVNKHTKVCSKHFRNEDFIQGQNSKRRMLKKGVVPSVFAWTNDGNTSQSDKKNQLPQKPDGVSVKEEPKVQSSGENSAKNNAKEAIDSKDFDKESSRKVKDQLSETKTTLKTVEIKVEPKNFVSNVEKKSESKVSVSTVERKIKNKNVKKESNGTSATPTNMTATNSTCSSPTKSEDSEQGSVSDLTPNGSSPSDSNVGTPCKRPISALNFQIGTRLEAKDLGNEMWYPVKVVEVDWEDEEVLIHFEKWSQRYDEWVPMDSSRLRPTQNPSPSISFRSDGKSVSKVFSVGDRVMAKWSDCRRYPAKVKAVLGNDRYEVLFFDGFTKNIKGMKMAKLENEEFDSEIGPGTSEKFVPPVIPKPVIKNEVISEPIGTKEERRERKRKLNVVELFHPKKRLKIAAESSPKSSTDAEKGRKSEKRRRRKENPSNVNEGDNEGEKNINNTDTNETLQESVQISEIDETVEEKKVVEDPVGRQKKKISSKSGGGADESAGDKPRRGGLRQGETPGKAKSIEVKSYVRKIPRKIVPGGRESPSTHSKSRRDSSKAGQTESTETPRGRKKEFPDELSKPGHKSVQKESDREEAVKWEFDGQDGYIVESADGPRKTTVVPDKNLPPGWSKHTIQRKHGNSAGKWDVFLVSPQGRRFRSRNELRLFFEEKGEPFKADMFDFCLSGKKRGARTSESSTPSAKRMRGASGKAKTIAGPSDDALEETLQPPVLVPQVQRRVKTLLPKIRPPASNSEEDSADKHTEPRSPPPPYTTTVASVPAIKIQSEPLEGEVLVGGLKIQMENNTYKCPKDGCGKNFRKENLLQMHIKHYHPEYNKFMGSTPNVADLAYARTIGESIDDLMPKSRYSGVGTIGLSGTPYVDKFNRPEATRKTKSGVSVGVGGNKVGGVVGSGGAGDSSPVPEKKKVTSKEKQQSVVTAKKPGKGMTGDGEGRAPVDDSSGDNKEPKEEKPIVADTRDNTSPPVLDIATAVTHREEKKELQTTIKTLMPVIRSPSHVQEAATTERVKNKFQAVEEGEEYVEVIDVGPRQAPPSRPPVLLPEVPLPIPNAQGSTSLTKSLRTVRRRRLSDFHFEPLHRRRKIASTSKLELSEEVDVVDEGGSIDVTTPVTTTATATAVGNGKSNPTTYRYSRKKTPIVHLEKLNVVTDSNGRVILSPSVQDRAESKLLETPAEQTSVEQLRKEELINCTCGFMEEDGLMIQCDLCLCWQHGLCNNIEKETEVPEKYVCPICLNPYRQRKSKKYLHDQDWLKEGKLPSLSFRSKNEGAILERETILKRSHDLTGSLLQIQQVLHSLRVKVNIAGKPDHPKLYLWAKSWEKDGENCTTHGHSSVSHTQMNSENEFKPQHENTAPCVHTEVKTDPDPGVVVDSNVVVEKDISSIVKMEERDTATCDGASEPKEQEEKEMVIDDVVQEETVIVETEATEIVSSIEETEEIKLDNKTAEETVETVITESVVDNEVVCTSNVSSVSNEEQVVSIEEGKSDSAMITQDENTETRTEVVEMEVDTTPENLDLEPPVKATDECNQEVKSDVTIEATKEEDSNSKPSESNEQKSEDKVIPVDEEVKESKQERSNLNAPEDEAKKQHDTRTEEDLKSSVEDKPVDTEHNTPSNSEETAGVNIEESPSPLENHGLLHQALTNGSQAANPLGNGGIGSQLDTTGHPMLQLPICQNELMRFASSMADNLRVTESTRPSVPAAVPVPEPPRAPQPEAPIDPVECRLCLLDHIDNFQTQIDTRLTMLEEQVAALESQDPDAAKDEAPDFYPQTKQTIQMLLRDLLTLRKIAALN
ncbi:uncharacterized protein [Periplaneta americana]|uniref:uncharacterized protein isoform X4 n=1 Tax=Periplaneta americana TaxID=6978 RepID=UPI0037E734BB